MSIDSKVKVLAVASGGGHMIQLLRLMPSLEQRNLYFVTTIKGAVENKKLFIVKDASRNNIVGLLYLLMQIVYIVLRVRPNYIITTGAAPGYLALRVGKIFGAKTMWIDSIANSEELSLSGQMALKTADVCLTQWPELVSKYKGLQYKGAVI